MAYPHLRALAALRFTIGIFLTGLGAVLLIARGGSAWAAVPLAGAALHFAIAYLDSAAVRSEPIHASSHAPSHAPSHT